MLTRVRGLSRLVQSLSRQLQGGVPSPLDDPALIRLGTCASTSTQNTAYSSLPEEYRRFYDGKAPVPRPKPAAQALPDKGGPQDEASDVRPPEADASPQPSAGASGGDERLAAQSGTKHQPGKPGKA